jgi:hypothetical protein
MMMRWSRRVRSTGVGEDEEHRGGEDEEHGGGEDEEDLSEDEGLGAHCLSLTQA